MAVLLSAFAGWVAALQPPLDEDWISSTRAEVEARLEDQDLEAATEPLMARPSVVPIFFVPTDWSISSAEVQKEAAALRTAMAEIQDFYGDQLGYTFRLETLALVQAQGRKEAYQITWTGGNIYTDGIVIGPNFENLVVQELYNRGFPTPPAMNQDGRSALIFVKGAGGWAGGREFTSANGGWAILGDWCIDSIAGDVPEGTYWWSGRRLQIGAAAHELGHTFGLPHPPSNPENLIMGNWWQYPDAGFTSSDRTQLTGPEKKVFFVARSVGFDYDNGDVTTPARLLSVYPGGEWIQSQNFSGSTLGPWQWTRVSTAVPGLTAIRSFSQGIRPTDGVPKQDFVNSTGDRLYSRGFVGGVWEPLAVLEVWQLGISNVTRLWGFEQVGGTSGDPIRQVAIPFDGKGYYTRTFGSSGWGSWSSFMSTSSLVPGLAAMRSFSEVRLPDNTIRQDVLSTDHATLYTRKRVGNTWSGWTAAPVINYEMPVL